MKQPYPKAFVGLMIFLLASLATALSAPITLELSAGSVIKGDLVSWNGQQAVVKAEFGSMTFKRDQLNLATIQRLELLSGDPQKLLARISELETTVESLRKAGPITRAYLSRGNFNCCFLQRSGILGLIRNFPCCFSANLSEL